MNQTLSRLTPLTRLCLFVSLVILGSQMLIVNKFAGLGEEVTSLKSKSIKLELENMEIKSSILSKQSIATIFLQSGQLGLVSAKTIFEKSYPQVAKAYGGF